MVECKNLGESTYVYGQSVPLLTSTSRTTMARARKTKASGIEMTPRQAEVLEAVRAFFKMAGGAPTRTELGKILKIKHQSTVDHHLHALARKRWIEVVHGMERGIRLLREGVPLYEPDDFRRGIPAGYAFEERAKEPVWIDNDRLWEIFETTPDLCLRIRGDAMDKAGLTDGGIVALWRSPEGQNPEGQNIEPAQDGDVVAARVGDTVVLRRYHRVDNARVELRAESTNREHTVIRIDRENDDVEIIGVMIGRIVAERR